MVMRCVTAGERGAASQVRSRPWTSGAHGSRARCMLAARFSSRVLSVPGGRRLAVASPNCHATDSSNPTQTPKVLHDITLLLPQPGENKYFKKKMEQTSQRQLLSQYGDMGYVKVLQADEEPPPGLLFACDGVVSSSIDVMEMADNMVLAFVLDSPADLSLLKRQAVLAESWSRTKNTVENLDGQSRNRTAADERACGEWAVARLLDAGHADIKRWCFKHMRSPKAHSGTGRLVIEVDGAATSSSHTIIIERKPEINADHIQEFAAKIFNFEYLVGANAPNSDMFRNASGGLKTVIAILMADNWTTDQKDLRASKKMMMKYGIFPALPDGRGGLAFGDSCHPWHTPAALQVQRP